MIHSRVDRTETALLEKRWYVAILVFKSCILEGSSDPSVDVQYRLIRANDHESAYDRALQLGDQEKSSYENPYGQTCVWMFQGLADLQCVIDEKLEDGVEIYGLSRSVTLRTTLSRRIG